MYLPLAEILVTRLPTGCYWTVYVPNTDPIIMLQGYDKDYEECWQKAVRARDFLQKHGLEGDRPL